MLGGTWIRNRVRMIPEPISASEYREGTLIFLLVAAISSIAITLGMAGLQFLVSVGYSQVVVVVGAAVVVGATILVVLAKGQRAG